MNLELSVLNKCAQLAYQKSSCSNEDAQNQRRLAVKDA